MNYELDWAWLGSAGGNIEVVGILTGIPEEDILIAQKEVWRVNKYKDLKSWPGPAFIKMFRFLGFNTNDRFIKFDPNTDKPCIMRTTCYRKNYWFVWIYDGEHVNNTYTLAEWKKEYKKFKITSMLQVWI